MSQSSDHSVVLPAHLHARPAGALVKLTADYDATVEIRYGAKSANARSILALLSLGATAGETVHIHASGPQADAAAAAAANLLTTVT